MSAHDFQDDIWDALRDLVVFVQFKEREKHTWRSITICNYTKINTLPWVFFTFFKLYKCYQIDEPITSEM